MSTPAQGAVGAGKSFQERVVGLFRHVCTEVGDPTDLPERRDRFGEEAMEIFQATDGTREAAHQIVDYVFSREKGQARKEIGQGLVTLTALATHAGHDLMACGEEELARMWRPESVEKVRRKRAARHGRGPLPGLDAVLATPRTDSDERTAGEDLRAILLRAKWIGQQTTPEDFAARAVFETREDAHEAYRALVALRDATPAPSSPGVPDSVRALSEAVREVVRAAWRLCDQTEDGGEESQRVDTDSWRHLAATIESLEALIPAEEHPATAGHAATLLVNALAAATFAPASGNLPDSVRERLVCVVPVGWKLVPEKPTSLMCAAGAEENTDADQECHIYEAMLANTPEPPISTHPAGQGTGQGAAPSRIFGDPSEPMSRPSFSAPGSTRTGPVGVEDLNRLAKAVEALNGSQLWLDDNSPWRIMLKRGRFNAAVAEAHPESAPGDGEWNDGASICAIVNEAIKLIAARPAAPEAQGAWRPISTAPRNDTLVMLGWWYDVNGEPRWVAVAGWYEAGPADQCWYAALDEERIEPTHWQPLGPLPAPPSSGQEG